MATPVPKPADAGAGVAAIADTKLSYSNVRNGPGTGFDDIGDIRDKTLVTYYPGSNQNGWVWVEQLATKGWISTTVVQFNPVDIEPPKDFPPTPYDGKMCLWHWKGTAIPETTIAQFISNVKRDAPNLGAIFVKVGDGSSWQGNFDSGDMAVNGPNDVARWVQELGKAGIEFHAWVVLKGVDVDGEANIMIQTANVPGVKSIILDVEPYENYWEVGPEPVSQLMRKVRAGVPDGFHLGLCIDPRRLHYKSVFPDEWHPFVDSVHTMSYWRTFRRSVEDTLRETYEVWGGYGKPLYPILQGSATVQEQKNAISLATTQYGAKGLSWWRYGTIAQYDAINVPLSTNDVPGDDDEPPPGTAFGHEVVILPDDKAFRHGTYTGEEEYVAAQGAYGWTYYYTTTEPSLSKVWAEWRTALPADGIYQIAVFIPARHTTTRKARYKIHGIRGTNTEVVVDLNQFIHRNEWVPLGVFDLVKNQQNAGKVFLNDVTGEDGQEIAFDALRYRQIVKLTIPDPPNVPVADGFDAPVGTAQERTLALASTPSSGSLTNWFNSWNDKTGFGRGTTPDYVRNFSAYHTGVDLNFGGGNADLGKPVYAPASGMVIYSAHLPVWGNVTVIRHDPLYRADGPVLYSRFGHMQNVTVKAGMRVNRGQQIGEVGRGDRNRFTAHLHYDIVQTALLETKPNDWPRKDITSLERNYVDPLLFTANNRPR
jgi:murein DD-endopeptidase MepM/ murein hydrolase activator NlpD